MRNVPTLANPFVMITDPETILAAVERSERLNRLSRKVYRPLDRPLIPKVARDTADFDRAIDDEAEIEDDALADRIRGLGKRVVCCEDVFVHHEGSASFKALDRAVYRALMERNRRLFERFSGTRWQPHAHRPDRHRPVD